MKKMKKLVNLLLAAVMMMAMTIVVSAANNSEIVIKKGNANIADGHVYTAFQIFSGNLAADKTTLTDIGWGSGVDESKLLTALNTTTEGSLYYNCKTAEDVANVLKNANATQTEDFVAKVSGCLKGNGTDSITTEGTTKISGLAHGYYFVKDKNKIQGEGTDAYTKFIVFVAEKTKEVTVKADAPSITKKIVDGSKRVDQNTASIGDEVTYELKSKVPAMEGYDRYYFIMNDTLSKGLTYKEISSIKIGDKTLTNNTDYTVEVKAPAEGQVGETTVKIVFKNFLQYKELYEEQDVVVTMVATVNNNAVIGTTGNPNKVNLQYSNNPNVKHEGDSDTPEEGEVIGQTPNDIVITYLTGIEITKKDESGNVLAGAEFKITGESLKVVKVTKEKFEEVSDGSGTYYKLLDGTYTTTAPTKETESKYESKDKKYKSVSETTYETKTENVDITAITGADGIVKFEGLGAGTYTIEEIKAPVGYNMLKEKITVVIDAYETKPATDTEEAVETKLTFEADVVTAENETITWKSKVTGGAVKAETEETTGVATFDVENKKGATLPETGGIGTTIFYVLGAILAIGAGLLLVTKKRMSAEK